MKKEDKKKSVCFNSISYFESYKSLNSISKFDNIAKWK